MLDDTVRAAVTGLPSSRRALLTGLALTPFAAAPVAADLADMSPTPVDSHVARKAQALALYRRHRETEWGWRSQSSSPEYMAADRAHGAVMDFATEACDMALPTSIAGLGIFAITLALAQERFANPETMYLDERMLSLLIEAVLKVTGEALPADYRGLIYNPDAWEDCL